MIHQDTHRNTIQERKVHLKVFNRKSFYIGRVCEFQGEYRYHMHELDINY